jgi:hypothetical protein
MCQPFRESFIYDIDDDAKKTTTSIIQQLIKAPVPIFDQ